MKYEQAAQIRDILKDAKHVVILQADNPDGDSLGSALALEQILGDIGKEPYLYCGVDIPQYLTYMPGWDRVSKELPRQFDVSIIVDTSADSLFETLNATPERTWLNSKPCIVIDHHDVPLTIPYATVHCNQTAVAAGEVIYELAQQLDWPLALNAKEMIAIAIQSDSLGLSTDATTARSIHIIGELVEGGVKIAELEHKRRAMQRKSPDLTHYKGELLQRIEYYNDDRIALIAIPWREIEQYSQQYNPSMLVIEDMRMTISTDVAIALKLYKDGKITGKIRCNQNAPIAAELAQHFGGGGHPYASGFKIQDGRPFTTLKADCIKAATALLHKLPIT